LYAKNYKHRSAALICRRKPNRHCDTHGYKYPFSSWI